MLIPFAGNRGEKPRPRAGVQELLRASREPNESRALHRQLRETHGSEHHPRAGPDAQEGSLDHRCAGDEHYGIVESPRRGYRHVERSAGSYKQHMDEGNVVSPATNYSK